MHPLKRSASYHQGRAATWLVTGVALSLTLDLVLAFGFDVRDTPAPLLAWVGSWGAAYHLYWCSRQQGRRAWLFAGGAAIGPVPALLVYGWLRYRPSP
ncbi:MAG TPA: hypothetical protein DGV23_04815 [Stenotrophomonas sp.]|nr:hypothetical protein [Stenotrophomonas sp.]